jgi:hypothetical protein
MAKNNDGTAVGSCARSHEIKRSVLTHRIQIDWQEIMLLQERLSSVG